MNTMQLMMALALFGADAKDPNFQRNAGVLMTSASAPYINQAFVERAWPEALFFFNAEDLPGSNAWVNPGHFLFKKLKYPEGLVTGKFQVDPAKGDYLYALPAEPFLSELRNQSKDIDETFFFVQDNEANKEPVKELLVNTKDDLKQTALRFFALPRKSLANDGVAADKVQFTFPPAARSILIEIAHQDVINAKLARLKLGMAKDPNSSKAAEANPQAPATIGRDLYKEHYDHITFKVKVQYEPPNRTVQEESLGSFAVTAQTTQMAGLLVLPTIGLSEFEKLFSRGGQDLRTEPAPVLAVMRDQNQNRALRKVIGFDIDAHDFINRILGPTLTKGSGEGQYCCKISETNQALVTASACKRRKAADGTESGVIEIRHTPGQPAKPHVFRVKDVEKNVHVWRVEVTVEPEVNLDFANYAPVVSREVP